MCEPKATVFGELAPTSGTHPLALALGGNGRAGEGATGSLSLATPRGTRRRRLWGLDGHADCPVVGVCLPMPA